MKLDISQNEFPSITHKSIWHAALFLAPFREIVPAQLSEKEAMNLREGERNLYTFFCDLYWDMYNNPEAYYLPVGEYDKYMNVRNSTDQHHKSDQKESSLRNKFQQSIQFYQRLLYDLGLRGVLDNISYNLYMDKADFLNTLKGFKLSKIRGEEKERSEALCNAGLDINISEDRVVISNKRYPKMLLALSALCKSNKSKYAYTNFLRCDFRAISGAYQPEFEDAVSILSGDHKTMAVEMDRFMRGLKCKALIEPLKSTTLYSGWKVKYSLKGKSIYTFYSDINTLEMFAYFNHHTNVSRMGYILKDQFSELYDWFFERIPMRRCSCKNNNLVDIGGQEKRICGLINRLVVQNPSNMELENLKMIIQIYLENIVR